MILRLLAGIWICVVALGASFGTTQWKIMQAQSQAAAAAPKKKPSELRKLRAVTVPLIANGKVQGYLVTQLNFVADGEALKQLEVPPDAFVTDEAFRLLYADEKLDYRNLDRFDVHTFAAQVKANVNARLKADVVADVLVQEFNFVGAEDVRK
jgi:hypothetical protein